MKTHLMKWVSIMTLALAASAAFADVLPESSQSQNDHPARELFGVEDLYFDAGGSIGYASTVNTQPKLVQMSLGVTTGIWFRPEFLFAGFTTDFRVISQYSEITSAGNMKGTRMNAFSPTIGMKWRSVLMKLDLQMTGNFSLSKATVGGVDAAYKNPLGARFIAMTPVWQQVHVGGSVEYVTFSRANDLTLNEKLKQWTIGVTAAYVF